jgi:hypothetical protein
MKPFERDGRCSGCGQSYLISGLALHPGAETEGPTRFLCSQCGAWVSAYVPGSVNTEKLVVKVKEGATPAV